MIIAIIELKLKEICSNLIKIEGVKLKLSDHCYNFHICPSIQLYVSGKLLILTEVLTELKKMTHNCTF